MSEVPILKTNTPALPTPPHSLYYSNRTHERNYQTPQDMLNRFLELSTHTFTNVAKEIIFKC